MLYHWDSVGDVLEEDDPIYQACSGGGGGGGAGFQFAYTITYDDDTNAPDLVQFCPVSRPSKLTNALHNLTSSSSSGSSLTYMPSDGLLAVKLIQPGWLTSPLEQRTPSDSTKAHL